MQRVALELLIGAALLTAMLLFAAIGILQSTTEGKELWVLSPLDTPGSDLSRKPLLLQPLDVVPVFSSCTICLCSTLPCVTLRVRVGPGLVGGARVAVALLWLRAVAARKALCDRPRRYEPAPRGSRYPGLLARTR